jgi:O-antigen/teichoic acid export membrane protein
MQAIHRVAANTGILYVRMAITVFISLYATRLILTALGIEDFGLYNLVGGVIAMLGFLNGSMAAASQRFMSFAQGAGDIEKVKRIFNMSTILHAGIAIIVLSVLEIAGYFFFNGILNIEESRVSVAKLVYQFMVASTLFTIISVPYEAVITSHENMLFYAILGIVEAALKLVIAFYITYSTFDHLVIYGLLMAVLSVFLLLLRRIYCHWKYPECEINIRKYYDKSLLKRMSGFAGLSLLSMVSVMIANYGQVILINMFFGTGINAAQGIANQISGQLAVFAATLIKALSPMITKSEGAGNRTLMLKATMMGSKVSFFLMMALHIPILIEMPFILKFWLKNVPDFAVIFCRLLLIRNLIEQLFIPVASAISAEGNIKGYQISVSLLALFPLPVTYLLFKNNYPPYTLYIVFIALSIFASIIIAYYAKKNCKLSVSVFLRNVIGRCVFSFVMVFILSLIPYFYIQPGFMRFVSVVLTSILCYLLIVYFIGFSRDERVKIKQLGSFLSEKLGVKNMSLSLAKH